MKQHHHPACLFESFKRVKATTKIIDEPDDMEGWDAINKEDQEVILKLIRAHESFAANKKSPSGGAKNAKAKKAAVSSPVKPPEELVSKPIFKGDVCHKDNSFRAFRRLVANIADTSSYLDKTELVRTFFNKGLSLIHI